MTYLPPLPDNTPHVWMSDAVCVEIGTDLFFSERKGDTLASAKSACRSCPVRAQCLEYAMEAEAQWGSGSREGVYGGLSPRERADLARQREAS